MFTILHEGEDGATAIFSADRVTIQDDTIEADGGVIKSGMVYVMNASGATVYKKRLQPARMGSSGMQQQVGTWAEINKSNPELSKLRANNQQAGSAFRKA